MDTVELLAITLDGRLSIDRARVVLLLPLRFENPVKLDYRIKE